MRKVEVERLAVLRAKQKNGQALNEKEVERLAQLEELERRDANAHQGSKDTQESGRSGGGADNASSSSDNNPGGGNTGGGEQVGSTGAGVKQGKRTERTPNTPGASDPSRDASPQTGNNPSVSGGESQRSGDSFGEYRGETRDSAGTANAGADNKTSVLVTTSSGLKAPKSAKVDRNKKPTGKETTPEDIYSTILMSGFSLVANATGRRHWEIEKTEADAVSIPLSKMLDSMSSANKKKLEKAMNPIMLGSAVAGIVIPRLMVDLSMMKGARRNVPTLAETAGTAGNTRQIESVGSSDIQSTINVGTPRNEGSTVTNSKTSSPNVAPELAKLVNASNQ